MTWSELVVRLAAKQDISIVDPDRAFDEITAGIVEPLGYAHAKQTFMQGAAKARFVRFADITASEALFAEHSAMPNGTEPPTPLPAPAPSA